MKNKFIKNSYLSFKVGLVLCLFCSKGYSQSDNANNGIQKIKHVIVIMQENRSFDHYFGTYPGADGIPMKNGVPTVCCWDPLRNQCVKPYHDSHDFNLGGPHDLIGSKIVIDNGRMDGFILSVRNLPEGNAKDPKSVLGHLGLKVSKKALRKLAKQNKLKITDVMGYHDRREIPNYWEYADNFVLQDHMFAPMGSWSMAAHLYMVSAWSAKCASQDPMSCTNSLGYWPDRKTVYSWTDVTYLLHKKRINWGYYFDEGTQIDDDDPDEKPYKNFGKGFIGIWNPLPAFETVKEDKELDHVKPLPKFYLELKSGNLPSVVWIVPNMEHSEHPGETVSRGQAFVTKIVNAVMNSPYWNSTAIFISWDEWGGFYDHVVPPKVDENGYGVRVPGLLISPYAKKGYIDHQILSFDAYLKFIEDVFINEERIDPKTDGRPDKRPIVRENIKILGDLKSEFDFNQQPRPPLILDPRRKKKLSNDL